MATYKDVMKWVAQLDTSGVEAGFKKIEKDGGKGGDYRDLQAIRAWAKETAAKLN